MEWGDFANFRFDPGNYTQLEILFATSIAVQFASVVMIIILSYKIIKKRK